MSDVYIPGIKSRFNSEKLIEDLMRLERIPRDRVERNVENLQTQKSYWQEVGRRVTALRESARLLYSYQNPFNERIAHSADSSIISATATRDASEHEYRFTVKQTAQADRFLSNPVDERMRIEAGNYKFSVGEEEISINFRGGTLRDLVDALNRRSRDKIAASFIAVQSDTKSLLIESRLTGATNKLGFLDDAAALMSSIGMVEHVNDSRRDIPISGDTIRKNTSMPEEVTISDNVLEAPPQSSVSVHVGLGFPSDTPMVLRMETSTRVNASQVFEIPQPPPGPGVSTGSVTYGGITIQNDPSTAPLPVWTPPAPPRRIDDMAVINLTFSDGTKAKLPPISDSNNFQSREYRLSDIAQGRTIVSIDVENINTHRGISIRNISILDPDAMGGGLKPLNPVSGARDAIITMEGIEMTRPTNVITDLIPGLTLNVKEVSSVPVQLRVSADTEAIKDALISLVGNYNRLMAEVNILTRSDARLVDELSYLTPAEAEEMRSRLGVFSGDPTLNSFKSNLQRTVSAAYPTSLERDLALLSQIGIGTDMRNRGGSYDVSRLRGYLEIDEKTLDMALETKLLGVKQLFGFDTTGDLIADTGIAVNLDALSRPFVEMGGIIALKTNTIDSRISQDQRRIDTMERQLAAKENELKIQYGRMEAAYARMEQMTESLNNFNNQNNRNNR
ncbi:MAG: flagellar filament capping protein FliD [Treponema sp.]|nr:flagellar filament capping protein FliD [Treponema sp.]